MRILRRDANLIENDSKPYIGVSSHNFNFSLNCNGSIISPELNREIQEIYRQYILNPYEPFINLGSVKQSFYQKQNEFVISFSVTTAIDINYVRRSLNKFVRQARRKAKRLSIDLTLEKRNGPDYSKLTTRPQILMRT
ncbi:hypothetical protein K8R62_03260 [bacterium]|nr:hypothetical protein [bacterium]